MSVHPCNLCGAQAPSCECPDGPHHADGRGDVTAEIASRQGLISDKYPPTQPEIINMPNTDRTLNTLLEIAQLDLTELRRTLAAAKESNKSMEATLTYTRAGLATVQHALQIEREARRALLTENDRLRAELAKRGPTLAEFIAWVDGFVRSSDAATGAVLNAAPSREIEDHVGRLDAACAAGASWRKLRAMIRAFKSGVR